MTSCVRILSTSTIDSSPSILIISNSNSSTSSTTTATPGKKKKNMNSKILINCGEGCQRTFVEYSQRLSTITTIGICSLNNNRHDETDMIGGLPGAILTVSDTVASTQPIAPTETTMNQKTNRNSTKIIKQQPQSGPATTSTPPLQIIGPKGLKDYISSLRHFMRRDAFQYTIDEVMLDNSNDTHKNLMLPPTSTTAVFPPPQMEQQQNSKRELKQNVRGQLKETMSDDDNQPSFGFTIQSIAFSDHHSGSPSGTKPLQPVTRKRSLDDALLEHDDSQKHVDSNDSATPAAATPASATSGLDQNSENSNGIPQRSLPKATLNSGGGGGCVSFILRTPPIPGKFLIEKAIALGVPKGPLYKKLKMGQNVSFLDAATNEMKHINSSDVVEPSTPPIVIMILYYPTENVAQQLFTSKYLQSKSDDKHDQICTPELVIHLTSSSLFFQYGKSHWQQNHDCSYAQQVDHILLPILDLKYLLNESNESPFRSAMLGAFARSLIHPEIYVCPKYNFQASRSLTRFEPDTNSTHEFFMGRPLMEYTILPRSKRGLVPIKIENTEQPPIRINTDEAAMEELVESTGAFRLAKQIINEIESNDKSSSQNRGGNGELIFTGTASALPCKHRNVTGMLLKQSDQRSIVLDIGEGTIGQLLRMPSSSENELQKRRHVYNEIKAVWISHPHADHHLGLIRLLKDRRQFETEKLLIIAPTPIFRFLDEISLIDHEIQGAYISIDCKDLMGEGSNFYSHQQTVQDILGITGCRSVPVAHCAHAYAVIFDGTCFGRVVYSGDCRPSTQLAIIAKGADVLIHESTFGSDMQPDAVLKKHSTIDEALNVGRQMECKCIVLTHFSQRYSKDPPMPSKGDDVYPFPIIYAYDFMKLQPHTLFTASKLTPALRLLYDDDDDDVSENNNAEAHGMDPIELLNVVDVLSIPGAFANASLL